MGASLEKSVADTEVEKEENSFEPTTGGGFGDFFVSKSTRFSGYLVLTFNPREYFVIQIDWTGSFTESHVLVR